MPHPRVPITLLLLCLAMAVLPRAAMAQDSAGEIALSEESVQLRYLMWGSGAASELGFGLFLNENRDIIATSHYYFEADKLRLGRLTFKAGPMAYAALLSVENTDVVAVAVAAELRAELLRRREVYLAVRGAYAPDILTFGAADNLVDLTVRLELPLTEDLIGFGGYRLFEFDLLDGSREVEESLHLGVRYRF